MLFGDKILKNKSLARYSKFGVGGNAEYLFIPDNQRDLIAFLKKVKPKTNGIKTIVIGAGSNLLIRDGGVDGIVILSKNLNKIVTKLTRITAECGALNGKLFNVAKDKGISGFEFLGCIPGTVGGSCRMNAGCYGAEVKDILIRIKTVDLDGNVKSFSLKECNLEYRKNNLPEDLIFLEASFKIKEKKPKKEIENNFRQMLNKKIESQPVNAKTCGSTFKNLSNMPAWKVIKDLGLQNIDFGGAKFSEKHANFLINESATSAKVLEDLIDLTKDRAKRELGIDLELEIKIVGEK